MTESPRRRSRARNALSVYVTTAALFVTVGGFLGVRMAQGQDPALGPQTAQVLSAHGSQSRSVSAGGSKPLQTRTSGSGTNSTAAQPGAQNSAGTHNVTSTKKKLQTKTSGHGGRRHGDGSESHDA